VASSCSTAAAAAATMSGLQHPLGKILSSSLPLYDKDWSFTTTGQFKNVIVGYPLISKFHFILLLHVGMVLSVQIEVMLKQ
jgi:hypothetical protein